jgi:hypothetical protein
MTEPDVAKAGWWARKKTWQKVLLIIGGVFIGLMVLAAFVPEPEESASGGTTTTAAGVATTQPDLPGIGDPVRDGKFEFIVTGIEEPGNVYDSEDLLNDEAVGEWFIVFMTVENIGDQEQTFSAGDQKVLWDGKEFTAEGFTWNGTSFEDLNPGIVLEATVMFDMPASFPEGGIGSVLELHDSAFSGGVNVYL